MTAGFRASAVALLLGLIPVPAGAQAAVGEIQLHVLSIGDARLTELALPVAASWTGSRFRVDVNTAWAAAVYDQEGTSSEVSGLTDLTVRVTVPLFQDQARLIVAGNLPTGTETLQPDQLPVAAAVTTDLLSLPVRSFGSGAGLTTGLAAARPVGDWVLGGIAVYRVGSAYESVSGGAGSPGAEFRPGSEFRMRVAAERPELSGVTWRLAGSWSQFTDDEADDEPIFSRGDRLMGEVVAELPFLRGAANAYSWTLYRSGSEVVAASAGQDVPSSVMYGLGGQLRYPIRSNLTLRPRLELAAQTGEEGLGGGEGWLVRVGSGAAYRRGELLIEPAALLQFGRLSEEGAIGLVLRGGVLWGP